MFSFDQRYENKKQAIVCYCSIILQQKYLHYKDSQYIPKKWSCYGLSPRPHLLFFSSEIFLQYTAHTSIVDVLKHHKIVGYSEHVGGTLIVYGKRITENKNVLEEFSNIYCTLNFTTVEENENSLNSLDVTLKGMENRINFLLFRKPH
jgi:hypothetical protein